eukprot:COSAG01_NODE_463_length_16671_cov_192.938209_11_plen_73_part_00
MSEIDTMGAAQFANFCKECRIKSARLTGAHIDRIFIRANVDNSGSVLDHPKKGALLCAIQPGRRDWVRLWRW